MDINGDSMDMSQVIINYYPENEKYAPHETYIASITIVDPRCYATRGPHYKKGYYKVDGCGPTKEAAIERLRKNYLYSTQNLSNES